MRSRGIGVRDTSPRKVDGSRGKAVPPAQGAPTQRPARADAGDLDDMDEIEAILKKHGI